VLKRTYKTFVLGKIKRWIVEAAVYVNHNVLRFLSSCLLQEFVQRLSRIDGEKTGGAAEFQAHRLADRNRLYQ
jgi:hypothetical protein